MCLTVSSLQKKNSKNLWSSMNKLFYCCCCLNNSNLIRETERLQCSLVGKIIKKTFRRNRLLFNMARACPCFEHFLANLYFKYRQSSWFWWANETRIFYIFKKPINFSYAEGKLKINPVWISAGAFENVIIKLLTRFLYVFYWMQLFV